MGRIRLYTDEHIARAIVRGLRQRGVDVLTVPEAGMLGTSEGRSSPRFGLSDGKNSTAA